MKWNFKDFYQKIARSFCLLQLGVFHDCWKNEKFLIFLKNNELEVWKMIKRKESVVVIIAQWNMSYIKDPKSIEVRSFEIITEGLAGKADHFSEEEQLIVKRLIHTTGDFD